VENVVRVEGLRGLAGPDLDGLAGGEEEARREEALAQGHDPGVEDDVPEDPGARDQGVDPLGAVALEVVPASPGAEVEREHPPNLGQGLGGEKVRHDGESVAFEGGRVGFDVERVHGGVS
jgi:hypothetical protein